jgi:membrane protease YdiL (CAAX protease family)
MSEGGDAGRDTAGAGRLGPALRDRRGAKLGEMLVLFAVPVVFMVGVAPFVGENPLAIHGVVWVANIVMILIVWQGLRLRGEGWEHLGLRFGVPKAAAVARAGGLSIVVLVGAIAGFVLGGLVGANLFGTPEQADMSEYNYLAGNFPMLLFALVGVYIVSSFGEEVVYRGFIITRFEELRPGSRHIRKVAVVVSAVIFGFAHYTWGPAGVVQTTFMGLALGITYLAVEWNLWINVLAHGYADTILLVQQYLATPA